MKLREVIDSLESATNERDREVVRGVLAIVGETPATVSQADIDNAAVIVAKHRTNAVKQILRSVAALLNSGA